MGSLEVINGDHIFAIALEDVLTLVQKLVSFMDVADPRKRIPESFTPNMTAVVRAAHGWGNGGVAVDPITHEDIQDVVQYLMVTELGVLLASDFEGERGHLFSESEKLFLYLSMGWNTPKAWKCCPHVEELSVYESERVREGLQSAVCFIRMPNRPEILICPAEFTLVYRCDKP